MVDVAIRALGEPGDLGWVVMAHGELYADEFGWDTAFEAHVARIVADYATQATPDRYAAWIAEQEGSRLGCVFCMPAEDGDPETAQLRILLVHPDARGLRLGTRLVDTCLDFATRTGYRRIRLWTNDVLAAARKIYLSRGFRLVEEEKHHSYGVDLVGQYYERDLAPSAR